jgi:membrane associated rhomboid family serine protease
LVVQYLDGLWTSAYAPANGFTSNTAFPALNLHYAVGFALAALVVLVAIVSLFTRERRTIALAVVLAASVWWAALSGSAFVRSSPNDPMYSVSMGLAFLIAFWAALMLVAFTMTRRAQETIPPTTPSTASG